MKILAHQCLMGKEAGALHVGKLNQKLPSKTKHCDRNRNKIRVVEMDRGRQRQYDETETMTGKREEASV